MTGVVGATKARRTVPISATTRPTTDVSGVAGPVTTTTIVVRVAALLVITSIRRARSATRRITWLDRMKSKSIGPTILPFVGCAGAGLRAGCGRTEKATLNGVIGSIAGE